MSGADLSGLNAGYVAQMLEAYLDAPASVSQEWRDLFERDPAAYTGSLPGLAGLLQRDGANGAATAPVQAPAPAPAPAPAAAIAAPPAPEPAPAAVPAAAPPTAAAEPEPPLADASPAVDEVLLGGVAAAMALVKAYRMHGPSRPGSTRSAPSRWATPRSTNLASSRL